jgi:hypothetical protein
VRTAIDRKVKIILAAFFLCASFLSACGGALTGRAQKKPVDIFFTIEEQPTRLLRFRGKNTLLVLMRTSEMVSQIYMSRLADALPLLKDKCRLVVLTVEPTEAPFVEAYREIENLPFPVGTAEPSVVTGDSSLGIVPRVPYTYFIDSKGIILHDMPGVIETDDLLKKANRFFDH